MSTIGTVAVNLKARTSTFDKQIRNSSKNLKTFGSEAGKIRNALVGLAATAGLGMLAKSLMSSMDATAKFSSRLGVSTEKLAALRHQAELSGASADTLDKGLRDMTRRLGEADQGLGQAKYALDALGLSAQELMQNDPAKNFELISKKIMLLDTAAERAAVSYQLFGRSGVDLLNTQKALAEQGLDNLVKSAKELGIAFSDRELKGIEDANDAMTNLKQASVSLVAVGLIKLAPALKLTAEYVTGLVKSIRAGNAPWLKTLGTIVKYTGALYLANKAFKIIQGTVKSLIAVWKAYAAVKAVVLSLSGPYGWAALAAGAALATTAIITLDATFDSIERKMSNVASATSVVQDGFAGITDAIDSADDAASKFQQLVTSKQSSIAKLTGQQYAGFSSGQQSYLNALDFDENYFTNLNNLFSNLTDQTTQAQTALATLGMSETEKTIYALDKLKGTFMDWPTEERFSQAVDNLTKSLFKLDEATKEFDKNKSLENFADRVIEATKTAAEKQAEYIDQLNEALAKGKISPEVYARALKNQSSATQPAKTGEFQVIRKAFVSVDSLKGGELNPLLAAQREQVVVAKNQLVEQKKTNTLIGKREALS